ncbi:MAG TPA: glycosyltransferase family 4 protein [Kofleriaceae bacterium]|nr:glycosyltransferase family 4 protein [Kofleriaceae bacterium]
MKSARAGAHGGERGRPLRIAQVSPLCESVPPRLYGGTERIVSYLTEALVAAGHDVTLFASGDSQTAARLIAPCAQALRLAGSVDALPHHIAMLEQVYLLARDFDVIHFHIDFIQFPLARRIKVPHVTTLHGRLDLPDLYAVYRAFPDMPVVSISDAQRAPLPSIGWQRTIHHGLPVDLLRPAARRGDYLAFLGRISPEKRVDRAIEIARRAGLPLRIAAKVDQRDQAYFEREIRPLLAQPHVDFVGEIAERDKQAFLGGARALLFPIDWPEPFGLVMIEAMACGTPVIAWRNGSVPEVIDDGVTGFLVDDLDAAVDAVARADRLPRPAIREVFERRFTSTRMAADYEAVYRGLITRAGSAESTDGDDRRGPAGLLRPGHQLASG